MCNIFGIETDKGMMYAAEGSRWLRADMEHQKEKLVRFPDANSEEGPNFIDITHI